MPRDTSQQLVEKAQTRTSASVKRPWWLWGVCVLVTLVGVGLYLRVSFESVSRQAGNDLPRLWEVPDFALIERSGQSVTRADLLGKVWIASCHLHPLCGGMSAREQSHGTAASHLCC